MTSPYYRVPNGYPGCRFCRGRGCLACDNERQRAVEAHRGTIRCALTPVSREQDAQGYEAHTLAVFILKEMYGFDAAAAIRQGPEACAALLARLEAHWRWEDGKPDGQSPYTLIFEGQFNDPAAMATLIDVFGRESVEHAFGPDGGGTEELLAKLRGRPGSRI